MSQRNAAIRSDEIDKIEELKTENFQLKRQLSTIKSEHHLLKVKVRKLQEDLTKRQKQIYNLVDPKKSSNFRKFLSENGAAMFLNLKEQKDILVKTVSERDAQIKKLQCELQMTKLYNPTEKKRPWIDVEMNKLNKQVQINESDNKIGENRKDFKASSLTELKKLSVFTPNPLSMQGNDTIRPKSSQEAVKDMYSSTECDELEQLNYNLQKIKLNAIAKFGKISSSIDSYSDYSTPSPRASSPKLSREPSPTIRRHTSPVIVRQSMPCNLSPRASRRKNDSPQSDIDRIELLCETPHEEIQQLQTYFLDILDEVEDLKSTIEQLKSDQMKTTSVLKNKEEHIEELAEEIYSLKTSSSLNASRYNSPKRSYIKSGSALSCYEHPSNKKKKVRKKSDSERNSTCSLGSTLYKKHVSKKTCLPKNNKQQNNHQLKENKKANTTTDAESSDILTAVAVTSLKKDCETQTEKSKPVSLLKRTSNDSRYSQDSELLLVETYSQQATVDEKTAPNVSC